MGPYHRAGSGAAWVSLKVDAVNEVIWQRINQPHVELRLSDILQGIEYFSRQRGGELVTETMLVEDINDSQVSVATVSEILAKIKPRKAYLSIPIRPPAEAGIRAPSEEVINRAYQVLHNKIPTVEYLIGYEGDSFAYTGNVEQDLLSITAVHPMREEAVKVLLAKASVGWGVVQRLLAKGMLKQVDFAGENFYVRRLHH